MLMILPPRQTFELERKLYVIFLCSNAFFGAYTKTHKGFLIFFYFHFRFHLCNGHNRLNIRADSNHGSRKKLLGCFVQCKMMLQHMYVHPAAPQILCDWEDPGSIQAFPDGNIPTPLSCAMCAPVDQKKDKGYCKCNFVGLTDFCNSGLRVFLCHSYVFCYVFYCVWYELKVLVVS